MKAYIPEGATIQVRDTGVVTMFGQIDASTQAGLANQRVIQRLRALRDQARARYRLAKLESDPNLPSLKADYDTRRRAHLRAVLEADIRMGDLRVLRTDFWARLAELEPEAYDDRLPWIIEWRECTDGLVVFKRVASEEERKEAMEAAMFGHAVAARGGSNPTPTASYKPAGYL